MPCPRPRILAIAAALAGAYVITYLSLIRIGTADFVGDRDRPRYFARMSADPVWNDVGYWVYWPCHKVAGWAFGRGRLVYVRDEKDLREITGRAGRAGPKGDHR